MLLIITLYFPTNKEGGGEGEREKMAEEKEEVQKDWEKGGRGEKKKLNKCTQKQHILSVMYFSFLPKTLKTKH